MYLSYAINTVNKDTYTYIKYHLEHSTILMNKCMYIMIQLMRICIR